MKDILISEKMLIHSAMDRLQKTGEQCLIVVDKNKALLGTITDGDIRRAILRKKKISSSIKKIYKKKCVFLNKKNYNENSALELLKNKDIHLIPVVGKNRKVIDYISIQKLNLISKKPKIDTKVIVMAGGAGTRLKPLTNVLPKPLIPIGDKTVIEKIIDTFCQYHIKKFIISINFKSEIIKSFFNELKPKYKYKFLEEKIPLGTAGCLANLKDKKRMDYIITNCDTLVKFDCYEFFKHHTVNKNDITILVSSKEFKIPYGLCKIDTKGNLKNIIEKPSSHHLVNTGIYIANNQIFKLIPKNKFFNFTDLILAAKKKKKKISVFPINDSSWFDTGQWDEYLKTKRNYDK